MLLSQGTNEEHHKQVIIQEKTILAVPGFQEHKCKCKSTNDHSEK